MLALPGAGWTVRDEDGALPLRFEVEAATLRLATQAAYAQVRAALKVADVNGKPVALSVEQIDAAAA